MCVSATRKATYMHSITWNTAGGRKMKEPEEPRHGATAERAPRSNKGIMYVWGPEGAVRRQGEQRLSDGGGEWRVKLSWGRWDLEWRSDGAPWWLITLQRREGWSHRHTHHSSHFSAVGSSPVCPVALYSQHITLPACPPVPLQVRLSVPACLCSGCVISR